MPTGGMKQMGERLVVLNDLNNSRLTQAEAAELLNVSDRQVRRLVTRLADEGPEGLINKSIGQPGHHAYSDEFKGRILNLATNHYPGAGPSLLKDLLNEQH
jgi:hypothetical protein